MKRLVLLLAIGCGAKHAPPPPAHIAEDDRVEPATPGKEGDDTAELAETTTPRDVHAQAMRTFHDMRSTAYTHKTTIDVAAGRYELDCSGFVGYVLAQSQPRALAELRTATKKRPLAKHFVEFFQHLPEDSAWHSISRAEDLAPGDMIAWLKPSDVVSKNTGHVMIVRDRPHRDAKHPDLWVVPIIDSTGVPHGKSDSRKQSGATGLGTGEILLIVDERGAPIGYRWSRGSKATVHLTTIELAGVRM